MSRKVLFFRIVNHPSKDKPAKLMNDIKLGRNYIKLNEEMMSLPNSSFGYWASGGIQELFKKFYPLEPDFGQVAVGIQTGSDETFVRLWWEPKPKHIGGSREETYLSKKWLNYAKGGKLNPFWNDNLVVVDWRKDGSSIRSSRGAVIRNESLLGHQGITWPLRAAKFRPIPMPMGTIFSVRGYAIISETPKMSEYLLALANSSVFDYLFKLFLGRVGYPEFVTGVAKFLPVPAESSLMINSLHRAVDIQRQKKAHLEIAHVFSFPLLLSNLGESMSIRSAAYMNILSKYDYEIDKIQLEIDEAAFELYKLSNEDRKIIREEAETSLGLDSDEGSNEIPGIQEVDEDSEDVEDETEVASDLRTQVEQLLSWCMGVAFGRWDVRMALDSSLIPELQGPFERLPVVAPAGLVGVDGYPAERGEVAPVEWLQARPNVITLPEGEWHNTRDYPLDVAWDGILVSDAGNARDLTQRVRAVLRLVFRERSEAIEDEMTAALRGDAKKTVSLEEYFANPKHFFASHLKAYSKSRRKAPIYWPLRAKDGGFTAWVYYPRLSRDTLPTLIADVIAPRVAVQRSEVDRLQSERASAEGKLFSALGKELDAAQDLLDGLMELEEQLRELVNAGYTVEHDDGVILSAAPLHRVMPWKDLAGMFRSITAGKYPWSHQHGIWVKE